MVLHDAIRDPGASREWEARIAELQDDEASVLKRLGRPTASFIEQSIKTVDKKIVDANLNLE
jgi:hypothetical protein